jgi:hypothetical protein
MYVRCYISDFRFVEPCTIQFIIQRNMVLKLVINFGAVSAIHERKCQLNIQNRIQRTYKIHELHSLYLTMLCQVHCFGSILYSVKWELIRSLWIMERCGGICYTLFNINLYEENNVITASKTAGASDARVQQIWIVARHGIVSVILNVVSNLFFQGPVKPTEYKDEAIYLIETLNLGWYFWVRIISATCNLLSLDLWTYQCDLQDNCMKETPKMFAYHSEN